MSYVLALVILMAVIIYTTTTSGKKKLKYKFMKLADVSEWTQEYIIASLGYPNATSVLANGTHLLQWSQNGCHIALIFDDRGNFIRISNKML